MDTVISYDTAYMAKNKGFNLKTLSYYDCGNFKLNNPNNNLNLIGWDYNSSFVLCCSAPTQTTLQSWLRKEHNINIDTMHQINDKTIYCYYLNNRRCEDDFKNYEEALEAGLLEALKRI